MAPIDHPNIEQRDAEGEFRNRSRFGAVKERRRGPHRDDEQRLDAALELHQLAQDEALAHAPRHFRREDNDAQSSAALPAHACFRVLLDA